MQPLSRLNTGFGLGSVWCGTAASPRHSLDHCLFYTQTLVRLSCDYWQEIVRTLLSDQTFVFHFSDQHLAEYMQSLVSYQTFVRQLPRFLCNNCPEYVHTLVSDHILWPLCATKMLWSELTWVWHLNWAAPYSRRPNKNEFTLFGMFVFFGRFGFRHEKSSANLVF